MQICLIGKVFFTNFFTLLMKTVVKNDMIDTYFKEEIEWDLEKTFYGVEQ